MEPHIGLPVSGYRPQVQNAVDAVNHNKKLEEQILRLLDQLATDTDTDKRWVSIARTNIELGFMAMNRSIFKPDRVKL
jgi:hypothetical protein